MKQALFAFFCVFVVFQLTDAIPQFEIRDGNCLNAVATDLVFQKHVHKGRIFVAERSTTAEYYGDKKIYCIQVLSQKEASKGSTVEIKDGGINHNFVKFDFHSTKNHGLEYNINVYARYF
jgi:transcriptional antiterminator Rof (Rho-off)